MAKDYLAVDDFRQRFLDGANVFAAFATMQSDSRLLGMVRVFSDETFVTYVAELCVDPDARNRGIGTALMEAIVQRFQQTAIFTEAFSGSEKLFSAVGITPKGKLVACSRAPGPFLM